MTNPVTQNICDNKTTLGGILFYKHLLLLFPLYSCRHLVTAIINI